MSENNNDNPFEEAARRFVEGQNQFAKMWTDFAGNLAQAGAALSPDSPPPDAARQMRSAFLKAWSQYCDEFMRSPQFLEMIKQSMKGAIEFRKQLNETLGQIHHEFQGTSRQDVDQLMMAMSHLERRLIDSLERTASRLDDLTKRLDHLERRIQKPSASKASAKPAAKKRTPAAKSARSARKKPRK